MLLTAFAVLTETFRVLTSLSYFALQDLSACEARCSAPMWRDSSAHIICWLDRKVRPLEAL